MEGLKSFDSILEGISKRKKAPVHKPIKFVNRNLLEPALVEVKLLSFLASNLAPDQMDILRANLAGTVGEGRVCECILELIRHAEERIEGHVSLIKQVREMVKKLSAKGVAKQAAEVNVNKCSLILYDSFYFLHMMKDFITQVAACYQVPYYYDTGAQNIRLRASLIKCFKNLNLCIDDMQALSEALWIVRSFDALNKK